MIHQKAEKCSTKAKKSHGRSMMNVPGSPSRRMQSEIEEVFVCQALVCDEE